jgi:putative hydrolase of the HAD superfamily
MQLLIDADDTLWENNIYFEQATHAFITFLNHSHLSPTEVRVVLNEVERLMGYGTISYTNSLLETYRRLAENDVREEDLQQIRLFGEQVRSHPLQFIDGMQETLVLFWSAADPGALFRLTKPFLMGASIALEHHVMA